MVLWEFEGKSPQIGKGTWVAPSADVIGDIIIKKNCYIGPGARVRGDYGKIRIDEGCAIQENVIIHDLICRTKIIFVHLVVVIPLVFAQYLFDSLC